MLISQDNLEKLDVYYADIAKNNKKKLNNLNKLNEFNVRHSSDFYEIEGNSITGGELIRIPASRYSNQSEN